MQPSRTSQVCVSCMASAEGAEGEVAVRAPPGCGAESAGPKAPDPASPPLKGARRPCLARFLRANPMNRCPPGWGVGGGREGQVEHRRLPGSDTALQDAVLMDAGHET